MQRPRHGATVQHGEGQRDEDGEEERRGGSLEGARARARGGGPARRPLHVGIRRKGWRWRPVVVTPVVVCRGEENGQRAARTDVEWLKYSKVRGLTRGYSYSVSTA